MNWSDVGCGAEAAGKHGDIHVDLTLIVRRSDVIKSAVLGLGICPETRVLRSLVSLSDKLPSLFFRVDNLESIRSFFLFYI